MSAQQEAKDAAWKEYCDASWGHANNQDWDAAWGAAWKARGEADRAAVESRYQEKYDVYAGPLLAIAALDEQ